MKELAEVLSDPSDHEGWNALLKDKIVEINDLLQNLAYSFGLGLADVEDLRQIAMIRIIRESVRISKPLSYWSYWRSILRSVVIDYARVHKRYERARSPTHRQPKIGFLEEIESGELISNYLTKAPALRAEVFRGMLQGETGGETASRLGTTPESVYALRSKIRFDIKNLHKSDDFSQINMEKDFWISAAKRRLVIGVDQNRKSPTADRAARKRRASTSA